MSWNYRIIHYPDHPIRGAQGYAIHEVYYSKRGKPESVTFNSVGVAGDDLDELGRAMALYRTALEKPALEWTAIVKDVMPWEIGMCKPKPRPRKR